MKVDLIFDTLFDLVKEEFENFSDDLIPLSSIQEKTILKFTTYTIEEITKRNRVKGTSQSIMRDMWEHMPEVFILCALVTSPTKWGHVDPTRCRWKLLRWWKSAEHPKGLEWIIGEYPHILPGAEKAATIASGDVPKRGPETIDSEQQQKRLRIVRTTSDVHDHSIGVSPNEYTEVLKLSGSRNGIVSEAGADGEADDEAGSMRVAVMPDLEKLPEILGPLLFTGMLNSSVKLAEAEEDRKEGKPPRKVTGAMRLYLADQEGQDYKLEVSIGFETGRRIWNEAYPFYL
ncbi:hypothetical protein PMIN04_012824 [Paraphaeosphaeria minitans]